MKSNQEKIVDLEELQEMFDQSFLPKLLQLSKRVQESENVDQDIAMFVFNLRFSFLTNENELTYEKIMNNIVMQLQPITKEDLENAQQAQKIKENDSKDTEDLPV